MKKSTFRAVRRLLPLALVSAATVCAASACTMDTGSGESDLTSLSARARSLTFEGYVYAEPGATDSDILALVDEQTQTMFGPLRNAEISANKRELQGTDPATFQKTDVVVIDTSVANDPGRKMVRVRYRYQDQAVVAAGLSRRSAVSLAVMNAGYTSQTQRILKECTANDAEAQDFASSIWYVFDPTLPQCRTAMTTEQKAIDAANQKLSEPTTQISRAEIDRLYIPTTVKLGKDATNKSTDYPEYDRLYAGGVEPGKLVIGLVNGFIDHSASGGEVNDSGYGEWLTELRETFANGPAYRVTAVEPAEDLTTYTVAGKTVSNVTFDDILALELDSDLPSGVSYADREALRAAVGEKIIHHWITFEAPVTVSIGGAPETPVTIKIQTYFGAESDPTPHKRAIKTSDVFIYNGHSYIGYGPLDPSRFSASDFPASYQILFIDGCVSYNYYERDYFPLKEGGSQNLELITNGLEAPAWRSGYALGRFLNVMLNGKQASYKELLAAAEDTDSLRVVDGELDNVYDPAKRPIRVRW
jgi:hypothetical protein